MLAYEGKEPYIFVSYSHRDADRVIPIIRVLKDNMCRVWFDEGLKGGESWNDSIAEHLKECTVFLLFVSPDSVNSKYVFSEINYALSKDKAVMPVVLEPTDIPAGLEMMLSAIQYIDVSGQSEPTRIAASITSVLPKSVISVTDMPFIQDMGYSFYVKSQAVEREETREKNPCAIVCVGPDGEETEIFLLQRTGAYEAAYHVSSVEPIKDYYFSGNITGSYQINIKGSFLLEYPLNGPDVDVLLICLLRIPRHGSPTMRLVDYHYVHAVSSTNLQDEEEFDVVGEKGWSTQIKKYLEEKLYQ